MIRVLLITGRVVKEHDYFRINPLLKQMLESTGLFEVKITEEFKGATARTLEDYDLVLMNYDGKEWLSDPVFTYWGSESEQALYEFVAAGKGIVFYHSSFSCGEGTPDEYLKLMGGGHNLQTGGRRNPKSDFTVRLSDGEHPITKGLHREWMVVGDDFLPVITWHPEARVQILASVYDSVEDYRIPGFPPPHLKGLVIPDGDISRMPEINTYQPVAWTNEYGKGRAFVITIGHDIDTMRRIDFLTMFVRGAQWAATGEVTLEAPDRSGDNRLNPWPYYSGK
ncbi:MAG: ThuA domain-containing protein [Eubacteriales bacterium]|nr:ThuA domain-containing protein [Eubacteriales bacterium]